MTKKLGLCIHALSLHTNVDQLNVHMGCTYKCRYHGFANVAIFLQKKRLTIRNSVQFRPPITVINIQGYGFQYFVLCLLWQSLENKFKDLTNWRFFKFPGHTFYAPVHRTVIYVITSCRNLSHTYHKQVENKSTTVSEERTFGECWIIVRSTS